MEVQLKLQRRVCWAVNTGPPKPKINHPRALATCQISAQSALHLQAFIDLVDPQAPPEISQEKPAALQRLESHAPASLSENSLIELFNMSESSLSYAAVSPFTQYQPLVGESFRLLTILPGSDCQPITCQLDEYDLDESAPSYEALSYVWGLTRAPTPITVNGESFAVTNNLFHALKNVRFLEKERRVWIDAICINQNDLQERSHQVRRMAQIYASAAQVVVWIGEGIEDLDIAFEATRFIADTCTEHAEAQGSTIHEFIATKFWHLRDARVSRELYRKYGVAPHAQEDGLPPIFKGLFAATWFERIWCFQEIGLAKQATIMGGDLDGGNALAVEAEKLGICAAWIINTYFDRGRRPAHLDSCLMRCIVLKHYISQKNTVVDEDHLLMWLHKRTRGMKATDPRDNVYGLMGLCQAWSGQQPLVADYESSVVDVYAAVTEAIIRQSGTLRVLAEVSHAVQLSSVRLSELDPPLG